MRPHPVRLAMEARDHASLVAQLAPDVVLHSPVTAVPFQGRTAVGDLLGMLIEHYEEWECSSELSEGDTHVLVTRVRIGGREADVVDVLRHDQEGRVDEIRVVARPLSSVAAFAAVVAPRLARRHGRRRALAVRAVTAPLPSLLAFGDRLVSRVARPPTIDRYSDAGVAE